MFSKCAGPSFLGEPIKQVMADSVTGSVALPNSAVAATAAPRLVSAVPMDTTHVQLPTTPAAAAVVGTTAASSMVPGSIGIALPMAPVPMGVPNLPTAPAPPAAVMAGNTEEDDEDEDEDEDDDEDEDSGSTTPEPQRKRRKIDPVSRRSLTGLSLLQNSAQNCFQLSNNSNHGFREPT